MKIRKRIKRTTRQYIMVAVICITIIGAAALITSITLTGQIRQEYELLLSEADRKLTKNQRSVYVAVSDIVPGDFITKDNVVKKLVFASQPEDSYMKEEGFGMVSVINIPAGTHLMGSMLTGSPASSGLREVEYDIIHISSNIEASDFADIRIMFPNGEDYIILSKKMLKGGIDGAGSCLLWLTEEEILRMASAAVDAFLYKGSRIYTAKYPEPNIQDASMVTYDPSVSTLLLIQDNPNIVETAVTQLNKEVRKAMENRLAASMKTDVEDIKWELSANRILGKEDIPAVLNPDEEATYQEELYKKEKEMDYGP